MANIKSEVLEKIKLQLAAEKLNEFMSKCTECTTAQELAMLTRKCGAFISNSAAQQLLEDIKNAD